MTVLCEKVGAINLAQGAPDFSAPDEVKQAGAQAILDDHNQYTATTGIQELRDALAKKLQEYNGLDFDPETEITVTCGSTEAVAASLTAVVEPGDEVIIFEPFYENYGPAALIAGGVPKYIGLNPPDFGFDSEELKSLFNSKTKALVVNTPNNPTGKVFTKDDLKLIADLCVDFDAVGISDEVYEQIIYDDYLHVSLGTLEGMHERTITISSFSKTYTVTGWRLGYAAAARELSTMIRKVHEFLTVSPPAPLQYGAVAALNLPNSYYERLRNSYSSKRDLMLRILKDAGFASFEPGGAYYAWADFSAIDGGDDFEFARRIASEVGVGGTPGSSFFSNSDGKDRIRFSFPKKDETLREAGRKLMKLTN